MHITELTTRNGRRVLFEKVERKSRKTFLCGDCGKTRERTRTFSQTLNPWNLDDTGNTKTRSDIGKELDDQVRLWEPGPTCGCKARSEIDERPDKLTPDVSPTQQSVDMRPLLDRASELYEELGAIEIEIRRRLVGLRIKENGRLGWIESAHIDGSTHSGKATAYVQTWLESKKNPKIQFDADGSRRYKGLCEFDIVWPQPE